MIMLLSPDGLYLAVPRWLRSVPSSPLLMSNRPASRSCIPPNRAPLSLDTMWGHEATNQCSVFYALRSDGREGRTPRRSYREQGKRADMVQDAAFRFKPMGMKTENVWALCE